MLLKTIPIAANHAFTPPSTGSGLNSLVNASYPKMPIARSKTIELINAANTVVFLNP